jgi:tetracycline resistance monooxygenase
MKNNLISNKRIAIIGGGPVGLTTALLLQQKGADVKVYERDVCSDARISGGSLDLHLRTGQQALEEAGILEEFYQLSYPPSEKMTTMNGEVFAEDSGAEETNFFKPEIDRNDLRKLLCKHIRKDVIVWDRKLTTLERQNDRYVLYFEGGVIETADIVIGANGGRSNLRSFVSEAIPEYTNTYLIQGVVENPETACPGFIGLCQKSNIMAIAEGHALATHYIADGAIVFDISFRQPENWFKENGIDLTQNSVVVNFLNDVFKNWSPKYKELFSSSKHFKGYPMRYIPLTPWKAHHHITLIGDAAHLMPPFAGVGVNIGLVDALNLTRNLTNGHFDTVDSAIADYEDNMFVYAQEALAASLQAEINIHTEKKLTVLLQGRNEWNSHLANPAKEAAEQEDTWSLFQEKVIAAEALKSTIKFVVDERVIFIDGNYGKNNITAIDLPADCTITISMENLQGLISGELGTTNAFMGGKLKVSGDIEVAFKIRSLF